MVNLFHGTQKQCGQISIEFYFIFKRQCACLHVHVCMGRVQVNTLGSKPTMQLLKI